MRFKVPFRGFHIGDSCVDGSPWEADEDAHAHITDARKRDPFVGFICARRLSDLRELLVHEIAHLAADTGHNDRWRKSVQRLGGRVPAHYKKRPRPRKRP